MAAGYACQFGDDNHPAQWLITHLQPPGTITVCEDDFPMAVIHLLAVQLGADPEKLYDTVKRHVDREAARQAKEADKAKRAEHLAQAVADIHEPLDSAPDEVYAAQQAAITAGAFDPPEEGPESLTLDICRQCGKRIDSLNPDCADPGSHKNRIGGYPVGLDDRTRP